MSSFLFHKSRDIIRLAHLVFIMQRSSSSDIVSCLCFFESVIDVVDPFVEILYLRVEFVHPVGFCEMGLLLSRSLWSSATDSLRIIYPFEVSQLLANIPFLNGPKFLNSPFLRGGGATYARVHGGPTLSTLSRDLEIASLKYFERTGKINKDPIFKVSGIHDTKHTHINIPYWEYSTDRQSFAILIQPQVYSLDLLHLSQHQSEKEVIVCEVVNCKGKYTRLLTSL